MVYVWEEGEGALGEERSRSSDFCLHVEAVYS